MNNRRKDTRVARAIKKSLLSAFVVASFGAYALENHVNASETATTAFVPAPSALVAMAPAHAPSAAPASAAVPASTAPASPSTALPAASPTAEAATAAPATAPAAAPTASAPAASSSGLKDGTYTGPVVNIHWGYVQVQATIQGGKIADVEFLQYPNERTTSVRINSRANPELQQEAIQAQSANVNMITGATLTSQGFEQSLQTALVQAQG